MYKRQVLSEEAGALGDELFLYEKYQGELNGGEVTVYDGDGMTPHKYKRYWDSFETGNLEIGTHYYEPDGVEYISYLWSDIEGVKTHRNISVGSAEEDILSAYPEDLYYVDQESASPGYMELRLSLIHIYLPG